MRFRTILLCFGFLFVVTACGSTPTTPTASFVFDDAKTASASTSHTTPTLPIIINTTEIKINHDIAQGTPAVMPKLLNGDVSNLIVQAFVSDDDLDTTAKNTEHAYLNAGYAFAYPGATTMFLQGYQTYSGLFTKSGNPDVLISVTPVGFDDASTLGESPKEYAEKFLDQIKTGKHMIFAVSAPGILQAFIKNGITAP